MVQTQLYYITVIQSVPQGSVLGPLLFLIYINDLHNVIKHSFMYHFADDTNLLYSNTSLKLINKYINHDSRLIIHWFLLTGFHQMFLKLKLLFFDLKVEK